MERICGPTCHPCPCGATSGAAVAGCMTTWPILYHKEWSPPARQPRFASAARERARLFGGGLALSQPNPTTRWPRSLPTQPNPTTRRIGSATPFFPSRRTRTTAPRRGSSGTGTWARFHLIKENAGTVITLLLLRHVPYYHGVCFFIALE
jgi:hypothetical protein